VGTGVHTFALPLFFFFFFFLLNEDSVDSPDLFVNPLVPPKYSWVWEISYEYKDYQLFQF